MKACFLISKKQFFGSVGDFLYIDSFDGDIGSVITFGEVLYVGDQIGKPFVANASVECKVIKHGKYKKMRILKMISQKHHRKVTGFRRTYTKMEIINIKKN